MEESNPASGGGGGESETAEQNILLQQQQQQQIQQQKQQEDEYNFIKSIIYGNQVKNSYGTFRAFCSAISSKGTIRLINKNDVTCYILVRSNREDYFLLKREGQLQEVQQNCICISFVYLSNILRHSRHQHKGRSKEHEKMSHRLLGLIMKNEKLHFSFRFIFTQPKFAEGFQEDSTIEGSGEKLLHLLQKFNVENVLIVVGIEQYNPLNKFEAIHFRVIVERAKDLLNNLYSRVVQSEIDTLGEGQFLQERTVTGPQQRPRINKQIYHLPQLQNEPRFSRPQDRLNNRPNHIFFNSKPGFLKEKVVTLPPEQVSRRKQIKELNEKLKQQAYQLEKILSSMDERDYLQLRFAIQYDQKKLTEKLLNIFMIICDISSREALAYDFNLQEGLENLTVNNLNDQKIKTINDMIRGDKRLTLDSVSQQNEALGPLFGFIQILIRSYENGRLLRRLQEEERQFGLYTQFEKQAYGMKPDFSHATYSAGQIRPQGTNTSSPQQYLQQDNQGDLRMPEINQPGNKNESLTENSNFLNNGELSIKPNKMSISSGGKLKK